MANRTLKTLKSSPKPGTKAASGRPVAKRESRRTETLLVNAISSLGFATFLLMSFTM